MDVYVPACAPMDDSDGDGAKPAPEQAVMAGRPVTLFCHGGVWASGESLNTHV